MKVKAILGFRRLGADRPQIGDGTERQVRLAIGPQCQDQSNVPAMWYALMQPGMFGIEIEATTKVSVRHIWVKKIN